ncbi:hypothetical protein [Zobellia laminariae]|uniref:hypothetical protein n=1 Tax=Zobellia laminariae TaxID=248906 RepID=UPI0026F456F8|nr:hypothetical protein [Zobellia laminariae]WKX75453.1 hypothetical protein Q5W13_17595 [Zobellia laminariae]
MNKYFFSFLIAIIFISCKTDNIDADLLVTNATIWTGNPESPKAEAMAIKGDSVLAVGSFKDLEKFKGDSTEILDVHGKFITPYFYRCSCSFINGRQ